MFFFGFTTNIITIAVLGLFSMVMLYQGFQDRYVDETKNINSEISVYNHADTGTIIFNEEPDITATTENESFSYPNLYIRKIVHSPVLAKLKFGYIPTLCLRGPPVLA